MADSIKELKETNTWDLYQKAKDYGDKQNRYEETNTAIRFYNGDQWDGLIVKNVEPVSLNFIKPIVNYKLGVVLESLRAIKFNADNIDNTRHRKKAREICDMLNSRIARQYENDEMDKKFRKMAQEGAITSESIGYVFHDKKKNEERTQILSKLDVYYADETNEEIEEQPYILVKQRMTVMEARALAKEFKCQDIDMIKGDKEYEEEAGANEEEFEDKVIVLTKFYKDNGTVHFEKSTRFVMIAKDENTGLSRYPLFHFVWEGKIGSARGVGEVTPLIHNQIESNKNLMRSNLAAKNNAYPQKIYLKNKIINPDAINKVGGVIEAKGEQLDDVSKAFSVVKPQQMSPDVAQLRQELINTTRELASASSTATGQVNPENASGKAILAVQRASQQPLNEQVNRFNQAVEDYGRIIFDHLKTYYTDGLTLVKVETNALTHDEEVKTLKVTGTELQTLEANVSVDVTPKSAYDKYAQELSLENLAQNNNFMNNAWLKDFVSLLDNDSVMPKTKIEELVKTRDEKEKQIRELQQKGAMLQQAVGQMLNNNAIIPKEMANYQPQQVESMLNNTNIPQGQEIA